MSKEAMKLALEAFSVIAIADNLDWIRHQAEQQAAALREALAEQPEQQEPFGYFRYDLRLDAWVQNRAGLTGTPFYTSQPAQRTWVGLEKSDIPDESRAMMQLFTDPENQPTQHGTVTLEYMQREIVKEREACAKVCEQMNHYMDDGDDCAAAIRARSNT